MTKSIAAIILAAGLSSRTYPKNKLTIPLLKKPLIEHVVDNISYSKINDIYVVTGHKSNKIRDILNKKKLSYIENKDYKSGLSSSLKKAIETLHTEYQSICVFLGDMPHISSKIINLLLDKRNQHQNKHIFVPIYKNIIGHPVIFGQKYFPKIMTITGDQGAKTIIKQNLNDVYMVKVDNESIHKDYDFLKEIHSNH